MSYITASANAPTPNPHNRMSQLGEGLYERRTFNSHRNELAAYVRAGDAVGAQAVVDRFLIARAIERSKALVRAVKLDDSLSAEPDADWTVIVDRVGRRIEVDNALLAADAEECDGCQHTEPADEITERDLDGERWDGLE